MQGAQLIGGGGVDAGAGRQGGPALGGRGGVGKIKRRSHENQRLELTHLQGFKQAFDKEELLQAVDG